ncbi:MAG: hypothetical protein MO852_16690, partial [Candidatus Devosia euplotis]|nr:hypothetical protein [Candidatus Devosia euplotis]
RQTGELRLGTSSPDAEVDAVALASKVKAELDAVKAELEKIRTALATAQYAPGPGAPTTLTFPSAYEVGYEPKSPGSESTKST